VKRTFSRIAVTLAAYLWSCGTPDETPAPEPEPPYACREEAPRPLDKLRATFVHDGLERSYDLYLPAGYAKEPTPLVFNFHGYGSISWQQELLSQLNATADREGFAVLLPNGTPTGPDDKLTWNAADAFDVDDVGFVRALIAAVSEEVCVDEQRIFATGMSNGGIFSYRPACELADQIAAVAPVAGRLDLASCAPSRPVPIMHFHGTADTYVPYADAAASIETYRLLNGCAGDADPIYDNGDTSCTRYRDCDAEVVLCTIDGGGHTWPGGMDFSSTIPDLGHTTLDITASDELWAFFARHPLGE
jgi:polyhydroxybutyrate depolymerase